MILITSAQYSPNEFQAEFGRLPPSFLAFGGKRLYEYQIKLFKEKYPHEKLILSLPKSFSLSDFERQRLQKLEAELIFVDENLSLGQSIAYCLSLNLPLHEPLHILHGDTYLEKLETKINCLGISKSLNSYEWASLLENDRCAYKLTDKNTAKLKEYILNGYFHIKEPHHFIKNLALTQYHFLNALKLYSQEFAFELAFNDTWLDFGLVSSYFQSKTKLTTQRVFNELQIKNNFVQKSSELKNKIQAEIAWFEHVPEELSFNIPKIFASKDKLSYKSEYLYFNTLSELFVFGKLHSYTWEQIFRSLKNFLHRLHSFKSKEKNINFDYKEKTLQRLKSFTKIRSFSLKQKFIINDQICPSLEDIVLNLENYIKETKNFHFIHGDFCFSNIMFDFRSLEIKTFDPRGLDFNAKITPFGDKRYDFAKLIHSCLGLYDFIVFGFFECELKDNTFKFHIEVNDDIKAIQRAFLKVFDFEDLKELLAINIHLFLSMLPLHSENLNKQNALLANALSLYIKLKNEDFL
ncbi:hypothetical protein [Campylobacter sp. MIT 97-5078]|uniref:hypothetical protein n=1 Tax=Campylobacter sp. MIT 97-5078 TaxID=1548153 RepID=UPI000513F508|nr:hypothetical protein [Campylobacter sp. MIT 97-5078]KGI55218.1 hypothetical protein LR59_12945 [Campylobacter sp. MIT 97-5078]TQR27927.1 capsular biosynthesis protein [Campylobacter sp. MIT 97-5078]